MKEQKKLKYKDIIKKMTVEEKVSLLSGRDIWSTKPVSRLNIDAVYLSDGTNGVRKQIGAADHLGINGSLPATCFPSISTIANSWDETLIEQVGEAAGREAAQFNVNVLLSPGLNIKRNPLGGRNFEYFSEDPYLSGKLAAAYIRGVQKNGCAACPKHFAANSQEDMRMINDSVMDEKTLREIYLTGFEIAVKEGKPKAIMTSYNKINGVYANENRHLLQDILRDEWKFDGAVVTDWGGSNSHIEGVRAGSSLEMPGTAGDSDRELIKALERGEISEDIIDERTDEMLRLIFGSRIRQIKTDAEEQHNAACKAAEQSIVLLKNEDDILPVDSSVKVGIIGELAKEPKYQGGGSGRVNPTKVDITTEIIKEIPINYCGYAAGYRQDGKADKKLTDEAEKLAEKADVIILYIGLNQESEAMDREHMRMPEDQIKLLEKIARVNRNIIAVLSSGGMVEMPWINLCKGLLYTGLGGQAQARAVLKAVTGMINPSGRLAETCPVVYEDNGSAKYWHLNPYISEYREGVYVGYRYYETRNVPVKFPFGFGLSYTQFLYSKFRVTKNGVSFTLENIGKTAGAETAQLYVGKTSGPAKELKGFKKVYLEPGQAERVSIPFDDKTFRTFDCEKGKWNIESGIWKVMVGADVKDIKSETYIVIDENGTVGGKAAANINSDSKETIVNPTEITFRESDEKDSCREKGKKRILDMNDPIGHMYMAKSVLARLAWVIIRKCKDRGKKKSPPDLNILFIYNMPFRGIAKMMNGKVSMEMTKALLDIVNGHFCRGTKNLIKEFVINQKNIKQFYKGGFYGEEK